MLHDLAEKLELKSPRRGGTVGYVTNVLLQTNAAAKSRGIIAIVVLIIVNNHNNKK